MYLTFTALTLRHLKIFAFILSFLVLALSFIPCADGVFANDANKQTSIIKDSHEQDHDMDDDCSPFCHCSCCAGFSVNHTLATVTTITLFLESPETNFLSSEVIAIALPIWQPPQLV